MNLAGSAGDGPIVASIRQQPLIECLLISAASGDAAHRDNCIDPEDRLLASIEVFPLGATGEARSKLTQTMIMDRAPKLATANIELHNGDIDLVHAKVASLGERSKAIGAGTRTRLLAHGAEEGETVRKNRWKEQAREVGRCALRTLATAIRGAAENLQAWAGAGWAIPRGPNRQAVSPRGANPLSKCERLCHPACILVVFRLLEQKRAQSHLHIFCKFVRHIRQAAH